MTTDPRQKTPSSLPDDEAALQEELRRESEEHSTLGDVEDNRNLSGSATWTTLPEQPDESGTGARRDEPAARAPADDPTPPRANEAVV
jgi:hypothetical protein